MSDSDTVSQILSTRPLPDPALKKVPFWSPGILPLRPDKQPNSSLRIAGIVGNRLYDGLRFEGTFLLLTPRNALWTLTYGAPDVLIVESTRESATGHWRLAQHDQHPEGEALRTLVGQARLLGIPSVYWITEDSAYHQHYREFATHFDYVFCADPRETALLLQDGVHAHNLAPCIQPAVHNPLRRISERSSLSLGILFDGWGDVDRNPSAYSVLNEVMQDNKLSLIESRYLLLRRRLKELGNLRDSVLGCVTPGDRVTALKYSMATITFRQSMSTVTTQQWEALEAAGTYCPSVHFGSIAHSDIRATLVRHFESDVEGLVELVRMREDELYRQRIAHLAWRATLEKHTFSHRVREICQTVGIHHDWNEYPMVSVISPTLRPTSTSAILENFQRQSYPNRELIVVTNGDEQQLGETTQMGDRLDAKVAHAPGDRFAGAAINLGIALATGDWCARLDDDDEYGEHYLLDMMLWQRAADAFLMGKRAVPYVFDDEPQVFAAFTDADSGLAARADFLQRNHLITGNSMVWRNRGGANPMYRDNVLSAADAFLTWDLPTSVQVVVTDIFNCVAARRSDLQSHTWRQNRENLVDGRNEFPSIADFLI